MKKFDYIHIILFSYLLIGILTIISFTGTGDSGDSILHYLFAKYAPLHKELFFNHWAKPLYVLLSSPFAQLGFVGVKYFNLLVSLLTIYFTYKVAKILKYKNPLLIAILLIFAPTYYILTFSGLTEPLFAFFLILGIYLTIKRFYIIGAIIISFTPFIRSEGLIILCVFGLFYIFKKKWKTLPFLASGHVLYSITGYFIYNDFLWVFNKIPYAILGSKYGSGEFLHFVDQLNYVIGVPVYILFCLGVLSFIWRQVKGKEKIVLEENTLIIGGFAAYFLFHTLCWYFGIFNSMGLKRVLIGVIPLISLISLNGLNFITEENIFMNKKLKLIIQYVFILYIIIFPFTSNPAAIDWKKDMMLSKDQEIAINIANYLKVHKNASSNTYFYAHPYLSEALHIDHFDNNKRIELTFDNLTKLKRGDWVIWDNWFAVIECGITAEYLEKIDRLKKIKEFCKKDNKRTSKYIIFKYY